MTILSTAEIWTELVEYMQGDETELEYLTGETSGSHPKVDANHAKAEDEIRSIVSARNEWPLDAWPPIMKDVLSALVMFRVTRNLDQQPGWIIEDRDWARAYLDDIKAGKRSVRDTDSATDAGAQKTGATISYDQRTKKWDADDTSNDAVLPDIRDTYYYGSGDRDTW